MWARVIEFMLAVWLGISPYIFGYTREMKFYWYNDYICAFCLSLFALLSFYKPLRKLHLCNLILVFWLIFLGYFLRSNELDNILQNYVVIALLLVMISLVPSEASKPPMPWRRFYNNKT